MTDAQSTERQVGKGRQTSKWKYLAGIFSLMLLSAALMSPAAEASVGQIRSTALLIPSQAENEEHLVLLIPDGTRFNVGGSRSGVMARSMNRAEILPEKKLQEAVIEALVKQSATPPTPCQSNPAEIGPRWIPVPCTLPAAQLVPPEGRP